MEDLMSQEEVAALAGRAPRTLEGWRSRGKGPPFVKTGEGPNAKVYYRRADVEAWLASRVFRSTAEAKGVA